MEDKRLRIVDYASKGNVVRLYLGTAEQVMNAWGDDWDDRYATDPVYDQYVSGTVDLTFGYDMIVDTADTMIDAGRVTKEQLKGRIMPLVVAAEEKDCPDWWCGNTFEKLMGSDNPRVQKYYFGDTLPEGFTIKSVSGE